MTEQFSQEPTKVRYERENGVSYWIMSDGSRVEAKKHSVPLLDSLKKPSPKTGLEQSPVFDGFTRDYIELADTAKDTAAILRSGGVGTGDKSEDTAQVMDQAADTFLAEFDAHQIYLQKRHGDMYQPPTED